KGDSGLRPKVDYGRCCWCSLCIDICPTESLTMSNDYTWVSNDADEYRFIPGIDEKKWDKDEKGYTRGKESWLVNSEREYMPELKPEVRKTNFDEMALGYSMEQALIEANRCLECGLCIETCPTHMDIPQYISAIRDNDLDEGLRIMYETNPMVEACGRICTARCEDVCAVGVNGKPVAIRWLKRYIADQTHERKEEILGLKEAEKSGKKVGIVGGGPAGLTAAFYLRQYGHEATIYEKHDKLGGMLKYGIPDYRLPAEALQREIDVILNRGVDVKLNKKIGKDITLTKLHEKFDAVFVGVGAQLGTEMPIEGLKTKGVYSGVEFLEKLAEGERPDVGKKVVVVGGGNTAMDACRSSVRLGAEVQVLYRRTEKEMPANREEIVEAKEEGVDIQILTSPIKISKIKDKVIIECIKME
ncbi:MAG: FAD-dependent oxidoreductase, partial [Calditrichia bacterium]|nr:FAD-dependent oxidoreductase [Calditrichia bacterium]